MDFSPTNGVSFSQDDVCKDVGQQLADLQSGINRTLDQGDTVLNDQVKTALNNVMPTQDDVDLTNVTDQITNAKDAFNTLKDKLGDQDVLGEDVQTLMNCLSGIADSQNMFDNFNPVNMIDGKLDPHMIGKVLSDAANWVTNNIAKAVNALLQPTEQVLSDSIAALQSLLDVKVLDKMLQLLQCVENCPGAEGFNSSPDPINQYQIYCITEQKTHTVFSKTEPTTCPHNSSDTIDPTQTKLLQKNIPSSVILEKQLSNVGLTTNGEIDWDSDALKNVTVAQSVKDKMNKISDFKKSVETDFTSAKDYSPIPEPPAIPSIPKINNPLNDLDVVKKVEALF